MAVTASGFYGQSFIDALDASALGINLADDTNNKLSLITNSATPDFSDTTPRYQSGGSEFDNAASGVTPAALASQTVTLGSPAAGQFKWDASDWSQASSTITNARASVIYDDGETNDDLIVLHDFGADYSTSNGTFTVQWHATNGIAYFDFTP